MEISIFNGMTSKQPIPSLLENLVAFMKQDEKLRTLTEAYRLTGNKEYKLESPLFAVACIFTGGKGMTNITKLTNLSLVDLDHVVPASEAQDPAVVAQRMAELKQKVIADPHVLLCYITMSGNGLRIIYRYEIDEAMPLDVQVKTYPQAFAMGNAYFENLLGVEADSQCKNITRLSGTAFDPEVYFNPNAVAFTAEEVKSFHANTLKKSQKQKKLERIATYYNDIIKPKLDHDGIVYAPQKHNDYVMRVGYMLAKKRYARAVAIEWALAQFPEYADVKQVINSCYDNTNKPKQADDGGGKACKFASVPDIEDYLDGHIKTRYNIITSRYEREKSPGEWVLLLDPDVKEQWRKMSANCRVSLTDIRNVIESDYSPAYHPFKEYLDSLPEWHEGDPDYIAELAATVKVKGETPPDASSPETTSSEVVESIYHFPFLVTLKKWLVAMIAGWIDDEAVNNVILVFIGEQGAYKTSWFTKLLPPALKQYFYTKTNAKRMNKDDLIALSQFGLICCEELDTMSPSELNQLKAAVTMTYINERAAYAHYAEQRKHINTFCGTGNSTQFLTDTTGNRRWMPYQIESILSPYEHPFNYEGIYSQAYALFKSGFRYWFNTEEIQRQNRHNQIFEAPNLAKELVDLYFRKPLEGETGEFVTIARAMQIISFNMGSQKLSSIAVSKAFSELGFTPHRTSRSRGFIAIIRTAEEIRAYGISQAMNG